MAIVSLEQERRKEAIAKIKTACLLIDSAADWLRAVVNDGWVPIDTVEVLQPLVQMTGTGAKEKSIGVLGRWIEFIGGTVA